MSKSYETLESLIVDLKKHFLTKQSHIAIQTKLQNCKQNNKSLDEFASEIEELLVNLTISQADGNDECYKVLKPLNEKIAIQKFAEGLRNKKSSIIISARNFEFLKDAIQVAKDEQFGSSTENGVFFGRYRGGKGRQNYNNNTSFNSRAKYRTQYNASQGNAATGERRGQRNPAHRGQYRGRYNGNNRGNRGKNFNSRNNKNIFLTQQNADDGEREQKQFFRS